MLVVIIMPPRSYFFISMPGNTKHCLNSVFNIQNNVWSKQLSGVFFYKGKMVCFVENFIEGHYCTVALQGRCWEIV